MGLVGSYPCVGDKIASLVLVFYFGVALGSGSNTQALYILNIKKNKKQQHHPPGGQHGGSPPTQIKPAM